MATKRQPPDMTMAAFKKACAKYGFSRRGLGYYALPCGVEANIYNAGKRRRDWLAYLIATNERYEKKFEAEAKAREASS